MTIDGEPWFVLADLCAVLNIGNSTMVAGRLAEDEVRRATLSLTEGSREVTRERPVVNESGMWKVILRSDSPAAEPVQRWVTHEVLPAIRKTGSYGAAPALTGPELIATALIEAQKVIEQSKAQVAELTPRAEAWDVMVSAAGDYAVDEAAKILSRDPGIDIGRTRLFTFMAEAGWIFRQGNRNRWHAYQTALNTGRLVERMGAAFLNSRTGEMEVAAPTIRVTPKGIEDLRALLIKEDAA
ncbi:antirepressor [Luteimicrobium album]|uniref:Antirepressor n=1 Tax=Luteimicrobium album TaxID=1054550 RepID=A0ABQ6I643_9MICO|nr:phage antirepressor KilAC domain-containing protein [Luteimicrobium album]GMA26151.1 antirepressor [Luteimicrobium album]